MTFALQQTVGCACLFLLFFVFSSVSIVLIHILLGCCLYIDTVHEVYSLNTKSVDSFLVSFVSPSQRIAHLEGVEICKDWNMDRENIHGEWLGLGECMNM